MQTWFKPRDNSGHLCQIIELERYLAELSLMDEVMFVILANKRRREQKKSKWKRASSDLIAEMKIEFSMALQAVAHVNLLSKIQNYEGHQLPSRRIKTSRSAGVERYVS